MKQILVTGADGQLGKSIQDMASAYPNLRFLFQNSIELDISNPELVNSYFDSNHIDYCINCAAYTNVEQAEKTPDLAFKVNAIGVKNIAYACKQYNAILIHISTDYVFDGEKEIPYTITDQPNPINEYGRSKLEGEKYVRDTLNKYFIVRTSWLYHKKHGHNFYKTILKKAKKEQIIGIIDNEIGCPTNANNLARFIIDLIVKMNHEYGIYHFTDGIPMTWFVFAQKIFIENGLGDNVQLEKVKNYRTFARRPKYSVLDSVQNRYD